MFLLPWSVGPRERMQKGIDKKVRLAGMGKCKEKKSTAPASTTVAPPWQVG